MATGAGSVIGGRFRLVEQVGQGGMGRVWRCHDDVLERDVAVKEVLLPADLSEEERAALAARTTREARSAARLEYVPGLSLARRIKTSGPLSAPRVAQIGAKIADALAHAHAAGIVHRDLKPDNILLAGDRVVVTDFGIARIMDAASRLTLSGTVLGTPHYMSPEQLEGRQVDAAADVWSLGATLIGPEYYRNSFTFPSGYYAYTVSAVVAVLTVAVVAWYGLRLRNRSLGGALLAGWAVSGAFAFIAYLTGGWYFRDRTVADNVLVVIALIGGVILALSYTRRRPVS